MANIRTGSIVSDIRGRVGSEIYSRNKAGAYAKSYAAPVQPNNSFQMSRATQMADAVSAWQALSNADRLRWNVAADELKRSGSFKSDSRLSGYNLYVQRYLNASVVFGPTNLSPINDAEWSVIGVSWNQLTESDQVVDYEANPNNSSLFISIYASPPVPPGVTSPNSVRFTWMSAEQLTLDGSDIISARYQAVFGSLAGMAGMRVFLKAKQVWVGDFTAVRGEASEVETFSSAIIQ